MANISACVGVYCGFAVFHSTRTDASFWDIWKETRIADDVGTFHFLLLCFPGLIKKIKIFACKMTLQCHSKPKNEDHLTNLLLFVDSFVLC